MSVAGAETKPLGLTNAWRVVWRPGTVYEQISRDSRYGWMLAALLLLTALIGWMTVETGLIDRKVDEQTYRTLAQLEREQIDLLSRAELSDRIERILKSSAFTKLIARGGAVLAAPIGMLASLMLIAAVLFAVVAMVGNKPDYPTLMAIGVYAAVADVAGEILRLGMMIGYRTMDVDTSLGVLVRHSTEMQAVRSILSGFDPFRVWFWALVGIGLVVTGQLSKKAAIWTCVLLCVAGCGVRIAMMFAAMNSAGPVG